MKNILDYLVKVLRLRKHGIIPMESDSNDEVANLYCEFEHKGYQITITRNKAYDR